ncbi:MAG TPA: hypothetical protein DCY48_04180 [Candidatus Magasanikbacteria bacterium]|nr:MAG: hypothetical protein A3I74_00265 [Candidatus Magasanikbacteria bacterium RIFCSPLOWO2_02_FULL_47_16]OGH80113.1 MAG: hypothetical protein A3C10_02965 [Candidatus Magasanikbacteria bacterium RIFCSPHIGHO2_02_FULL_48_18]OGH83192.1 MAG: hypothetical protein A3G08_02680 [Candidatus Magasanikbacteria bacterium RIFCSPLOWO2_12_FULL_47_9b]HAZ28943.1 hypothetical protein [Candidatus Magasanikbacteria bacterium]
MKQEKKIGSRPVIYVTRDIERALGLPLDTRGYFVVANKTDFAVSIAKNNKNVLLIKEKKLLDTRELLAHKKTKAFIAPFAQPKIMVFKNTPQIERICHESGWPLLNPPSLLSNRVEEKLSQLSWLGALSSYLPPHTKEECNNITWQDIPFMLQFNRAHTGLGTTFITSKKQLRAIQKKFPKREARVTAYIDGPMFTVNAVVTDSTILVGNISYQITGLKPFTDERFATVGNDWMLPSILLNAEQRTRIATLARYVGKRLKKDGWLGLFGIDVICEKKTGKLFLIEINARQPASAVFESWLQKKQKKTQPKTQTICEAHICALLKKKTHLPLTNIKNGAQLVQRVTKKRHTLRKIIPGQHHGFFVIPYANTDHNADLLRIQSDTWVMQKNGILNTTGKEILSLVHDMV